MGEILSLCGFKCNLCPAYKENIKTESDRSRVDEGWKKFHCSSGWIYEEEYCEGCYTSSEVPKKSPLRDYCAIRRCVLLNKIENCGKCLDYPCPRIKKFIHGVNMIAERTRRTGTKEEYDTFVRPHLNKDRLDTINEEFRNEFKDKISSEEINQKIPSDDIKISITADIYNKYRNKSNFDINIIKDGLSELYILLNKVMALHCHTPGGREQELEEREDDILFLFIIGAIGNIGVDPAIDKPYLEVEVDRLKVFGYKKYQVSRKVREMSAFGLTGIFDEELKFFFMAKPNVLISLKFYVETLLGEYSKKDAFSKFRRADMNVFSEVHNHPHP